MVRAALPAVAAPSAEVLLELRRQELQERNQELNRALGMLQSGGQFLQQGASQGLGFLADQQQAGQEQQRLALQERLAQQRFGLQERGFGLQERGLGLQEQQFAFDQEQAKQQQQREQKFDEDILSHPLYIDGAKAIIKISAADNTDPTPALRRLAQTVQAIRDGELINQPQPAQTGPEIGPQTPSPAESKVSDLKKAEDRAEALRQRQTPSVRGRKGQILKRQISSQEKLIQRLKNEPQDLAKELEEIDRRLAQEKFSGLQGTGTRRSLVRRRAEILQRLEEIRQDRDQPIPQNERVIQRRLGPNLVP